MADSNAGDWCLIESDPGVFTELIRDFGVKGVEVEELWGLSDDIFNNLKPIHGVIFLFKWVSQTVTEGTLVKDSRLDSMFFAKQVINNACATQAILSVLMNTRHDDVSLGDTLTDLRLFTCGFDPGTRGLAISNCHVIRNVHNSFARQTLFEHDKQLDSKGGEVFHFVSYLPYEGRLYELDGLCEGPLDHGAIPEGTEWTQVLQPIIQRRMDRYSEGEIHFNLMAIVSEKKMLLERKLLNLQQQAMETDESSSEVLLLQSMVETEKKKFERYRVENIRRKHNYLPFIIEMLKILAAKGKLMPLYQQALERSNKLNANKRHKAH